MRAGAHVAANGVFVAAVDLTCSDEEEEEGKQRHEGGGAGWWVDAGMEERIGWNAPSFITPQGYRWIEVEDQARLHRVLARTPALDRGLANPPHRRANIHRTFTPPLHSSPCSLQGGDSRLAGKMSG